MFLLIFPTQWLDQQTNTILKQTMRKTIIHKFFSYELKPEYRDEFCDGLYWKTGSGKSVNQEKKYSDITVTINAADSLGRPSTLDPVPPCMAVKCRDGLFSFGALRRDVRFDFEACIED